MASPHLESLKASLIDLVDGMNRADTPKMLASMERLDRLVAGHKSALDPRLAHFLERRSYAKALDFLGGQSDVPAGNCAPPPRS